MRELSLNVLDIAQNSIKANCKMLEIFLVIEKEKDMFSIEIKDDGKGMSSDFLKNVVDPYSTTRTTRKVGMGIPLFKFSAESSGGNFEIYSTQGKGTSIKASYCISHIDRMPLGDMDSTILLLVQGNPNVDIIYSVKMNEKEEILNTREMKEILETEDLTSSDILEFISNYLRENLSSIYGGVI